MKTAAFVNSVSLVAAAILLAGCSSLPQKPGSSEKVFHGRGFSLLLPADVTVIKKPGKDWTDYEFVREGRSAPILYANVRWYTSHGSEDRKEARIRRIDGCRSWERPIPSESGYSRAIDIKQWRVPFWFIAKPGCPPYVTLCYKDLNKEEKGIADCIIESYQRVKEVSSNEEEGE